MEKSQGATPEDKLQVPPVPVCTYLQASEHSGCFHYYHSTNHTGWWLSQNWEMKNSTREIRKAHDLGVSELQQLLLLLLILILGFYWCSHHSQSCTTHAAQSQKGAHKVEVFSFGGVRNIALKHSSRCSLFCKPPPWLEDFTKPTRRQLHFLWWKATTIIALEGGYKISGLIKYKYSQCILLPTLGAPSLPNFQKHCTAQQRFQNN